MPEAPERREVLRQRMKDAGIDLAVVSYGANLNFLLALDLHPTERPCFLLTSRAGDALVVPAMHAADVKGLDVRLVAQYGDESTADAALTEVVGGLGLGPQGVAAIDGGMRADFLLALQGVLPEWRFTQAEGLLGSIRSVKDVRQLEALDAVAALTDQALGKVWTQIREGMSELDVANVVRTAFHECGADATAFSIVGFGPNSAKAHHQPDWRRLRPGDSILLDIGARKDGYHSDITRVGYLGEVDEEFFVLHKLVGRALDEAVAAVKPGCQASEVDRAARQIIEGAGYGSQFRHRLGHGIGLSVHEVPYIAAGNSAILDEGMTFTLEPGVYLDGRFGVRLEQVVAVTGSGARILGRTALDAVAVPAK